MHAPRRAQDEKLPLHHAAMKGASLEVMKLLFDANVDAAASADKVRRRAPAAARALQYRRAPQQPFLGSALSYFCPPPSTEAARPAEAALGTARLAG